MKCKDIPDRPILEFLAKLDRAEIQFGDWFPSMGVVWNQVPHSVQHAMPPEVLGKDRLVRAKMGQLIKRGLVYGCVCGCRGDFCLSPFGKERLNATDPSSSS